MKGDGLRCMKTHHANRKGFPMSRSSALADAEPSLTVREAAVVTEVTHARINRMIDEDLLPSAVVVRMVMVSVSR